MKYDSSLVIDTSKYRSKPCLNVPEGEISYVECGKWEEVQIESKNGSTVEIAIKLNVIKQDGKKCDQYIIAQGDFCQDIADLIRFAIIEKRKTIKFHIANQGDKFILKKEGKKPSEYRTQSSMPKERKSGGKND